MLKFIREHILFLILLGSSILLRFLPLFDYQFTLDELSGLNRTRFTTFSELLDKGVKIDAHPALIQVLIYYIVQLFGYSTWCIKLPFLLFSLGATTYAYCFGYRHFSKAVGLFAALFFSYSLVFVFYAPIARMYISGVFFSMALLFHFYEVFFLKNAKPVHFIFIAVFALLSALNQHINALFALTVCVSGLFFANKTTIKPYLLTCGLTVLAYLPHLPITLYQLGIGGIGLEQGGWLEKPQWQTVVAFLQILFGTSWCYVVVFVLLILKLVFDEIPKLPKKLVYLLVLFLFNYVVVVVYSRWISPVYQHSVMLFSGVAMLVFVAGLLDFKKPLLFYTAFLLTSSLLIYTTYFKKDFLNQTLATVFEYQFQRTFDYQKEFGKANIYPVFFDADEFMREVYFAKYKGQFECQMSTDSAAQSAIAYTALLQSLHQNILLLSSANPVQVAMAKWYFPYLIENTTSQANNFKVLAKTAPQNIATAADDRILFEAGKDSGLQLNNHAKPLPKGSRYIALVDSGNEFPMDCKMKYADLVRSEGNYIVLTLKGKALKLSEKNLQVCISITDDISNASLHYTAASAKSAYFAKDSTFVLSTGLFAGSQHQTMLKKPCTINFYIWNSGAKQFLVEDFTVQLVDYWPEKWGFWK